MAGAAAGGATVQAASKRTKHNANAINFKTLCVIEFKLLGNEWTWKEITITIQPYKTNANLLAF
jgi:hypothetical protein